MEHVRGAALRSQPTADRVTLKLQGITFPHYAQMGRRLLTTPEWDIYALPPG